MRALTDSRLIITNLLIGFLLLQSLEELNDVRIGITIVIRSAVEAQDKRAASLGRASRVGSLG